MGAILYFLWSISTLVQTFMGYGSAYRATRDGGDNGVALFGWMFAYSLAALIPGLGLWLWLKNKDN